jgi:acetyltransferase-like isoleucine patch superfamily enzyme
MSKEIINQRAITFQQKLKTILLKWRYGKNLVTDGPIRILGKLPVLKVPADSQVILGKKVVLNSDANRSNTALTFRCTLACGLNGIIEIGDNTMLNGVSITAYEKVSIGKNCQIASCTFVADTDFHPVNSTMREREVNGHKIDHSEVNKSAVRIGDNVWIGWGCTILKGVTIGDNSIIAAGSVVLSDVPSNALYAGNPAVFKKSLSKA